MASPTFALYGISGVHNYGCEAIVRGTVSLLRQEWPDCHIVYASARPQTDMEALSDIRLSIVPERPHVPLSRRGLNSIMRRLGLSFRVSVPDNLYWLTDDIDCVLAIGGDNFTLWHGQESATSFFQVDQSRRIMDSDTALVLWGASVGPFEENPHAVEAFSQVFKEMTLITIRESTSLDYLDGLGVRDNVRLVADPAYLMSVDGIDPSQDEQYMPDIPTLAVNLSPLSISYTFGDERLAQQRENQARMIAQVIRQYDLDILLVPHVVCPWKSEDDDYGHLSKVKERIPSDFQSRVRLLPPDLGARRTKRIIASCRALVAARLHCCIAGMSMRVPTLLLSYSPKSLGMCEYIYGNRDWVTPVDSEPEHLVSAIGTLWSRAEDLHQHLQQRIPSVQQDSRKARTYLKQELSLAVGRKN